MCQRACRLTHHTKKHVMTIFVNIYVVVERIYWMPFITQDIRFMNTFDIQCKIYDRFILYKYGCYFLLC